MTTEVDVVVVGARCAGAATALLLARRGHRVLVLEKARPGSDTLSTHAFMRGGVVQLSRWGLLDRLVAAGTPPVRSVRFHMSSEESGYETNTVAVKPSAGVDALYAPRRTVLDRILVDAAIAAGADVHFGVSVTGLDRDHSGRVVGIFGHDRGGDNLHVRSRLVVGADGKRSLVARETGAATLRSGTGSGSVVYAHWDGLAANGYEWFYRPGASAGLIPTNDGEVCVFAGTSSERFQREITGDTRAGYLRLLKEATSGDARLHPSGAPARLWVYHGRPAYARQPWGPGWALVGDAGHYLDPLATHGMTDAFRDAELLADAANGLLQGEEEAVALAAYQNRRDGIAAPMFPAADEVGSYRWSLPRVNELLLELSAAMKVEATALAAL